MEAADAENANRPAATYDIEPIMGELEAANCIKSFDD